VFRNSAEKLWLPSAESKFREGVRNLQAYVAGLTTTPPQSRPINPAQHRAHPSLQAWGDMLGDAHGALYRQPASTFQSDDDFYHAQASPTSSTTCRTRCPASTLRSSPVGRR